MFSSEPELVVMHSEVSSIDGAPDGTQGSANDLVMMKTGASGLDIASDRKGSANGLVVMKANASCRDAASDCQSPTLRLTVIHAYPTSPDAASNREC